MKHRIAKRLDKHSLVESGKQGLCNGKSQLYKFLFLEKNKEAEKANLINITGSNILACLKSSFLKTVE